MVHSIIVVISGRVSGHADTLLIATVSANLFTYFSWLSSICLFKKIFNINTQTFQSILLQLKPNSITFSSLSHIYHLLVDRSLSLFLSLFFPYLDWWKLLTNNKLLLNILVQFLITYEYSIQLWLCSNENNFEMIVWKNLSLYICSWHACFDFSY